MTLINTCDLGNIGLRVADAGHDAEFSYNSTISMRLNIKLTIPYKF
ncbi:hypothetical protein BURKHO8Y_210245 [Burkholderia sp. 8Y]|nr:hypothetical protein BURKHO8Y_210245 [Burkholderia sp. 8Y]